MTPESAPHVARFLLANIRTEIPITTSVFAAVPADQLDYRPHPKSKSALELIRHLAIEDEWFLNSIAEGAFPAFPDDSDACGIMTPADAIGRYQEKMPIALERVAALPGDALTRPLDFFGAINMPAIGFVSLMLRHSVHHRGQLSSYLRSMGAKVPAIYGPSADIQFAKV